MELYIIRQKLTCEIKRKKSYLLKNEKGKEEKSLFLHGIINVTNL